MRKKLNNDNVLRIDEEGEIVEFCSAADRLRRISCRVRFFDPAPHIKDSSDIADLLLSQGAPPELLELPDFGKLELPFDEVGDPRRQDAGISAPDAANFNDPGYQRREGRGARISFKIGHNADGAKIPISDSSLHQLYLIQFLNKPEVSGLIFALNFGFGDVGPADDYDFERVFQETEARVKRSRELYAIRKGKYYIEPVLTEL